MQTIIGAPANGLQNYHLYGKDGKEMSIKDGGFSQVDLLQLMPIIFQGYIIGQIPSFMLPSKIIIMCQNIINEDIIFLNSNC